LPRKLIPASVGGGILLAFLFVFSAGAAGPRLIIGGDVDCSGDVTSRDQQDYARVLLGNPPLSPIATPCPTPGQTVDLYHWLGSPYNYWSNYGTTQTFGDLNCNGSFDVGDQQIVAKYVLGTDTTHYCELSTYRQTIAHAPEKPGGGLDDLETGW
jgi:hypothetical protein